MPFRPRISSAASTAPGAVDAFADVVEPLVPPGRADDEVELVVARDGQRMIERRGMREVDHHLGAVRRLVTTDVEDADDVVPALFGDALDRLSHLPVAVQ